MRNVGIVLIILSGILLRVLWLGTVPDGLHVTEATIAHDAWSLLHTGGDHNGMAWPLSLRSLDHGAQVFYTYLAVPVVALMASPWSVRVVNVFLSLLTLWLFWKLGSNNFDAKSKWWPLALLASSPWHFIASRWATPTLLLPTVALLAIYIVAAKPTTRFKMTLAMGLLSAAVFVSYIPILCSAPIGWERLPDNAVQTVRLLLGNESDVEALNAIPFWGAQYIWLTPFLLWGILIALRNAASNIDKLMLTWFVVALIGSCLTYATIGHMNMVWLPSLWLAARGIQQLEHLPAASRSLQVLLATCFAFFCAQYFSSWQAAVSEHFSVGFGDALEHAAAIAPAGAHINVTTDTGDSRLYTAAYTHIYPSGENTRFNITAVGPALALDGIRYWVASKRELSRFIDRRYRIESFGNFAAIALRDEKELACIQSIRTDNLTGMQDFGSLGINGEVNARDSGFLIAGQFFPVGLGAHGNSKWSTTLEQPAQAIEVAIGQSDNSTCSDGAIFKLRADGKLVFQSTRLQVGDLQFIHIPLSNAKLLEFITDAGAHSICSHNNWIRPLIIQCNSSAISPSK